MAAEPLSNTHHLKSFLHHTLALLDRRERRHFWVLSFFDILINLADIASLALLLWIIKFYAFPGDNRLAGYLPGWMQDRHSVSLIAVFTIVFALKNIAAYLINKAHYGFIGEVAIRISQHNLAAYQQAPYEDFINIDSSVQVRKICFQPFEFTQYMLAGLQQLVTQTSLVLLALLAIVLFNAKIFLLLILLLLPPAFIVFGMIRKKMSAVKKTIGADNETSFRHVMDALKGYAEANIYGSNDFFMQRFTHSRRSFSKALFYSMALQGLPGRVIEIFAVLGLLALVLVANWWGGNEPLLLMAAVFMAAAYKIIPGMVKIINVLGQMRAYAASLNELQLKTNEQQPSGDEQPVAEIRSLRLDGAGFSYGHKTAVKDVHADLQPGDFAGLIGASGLGKTTLLNLLLGFMEPSQGRIFINDEIITPVNAGKFWPRISYIKQQGFLINDSIEKNISLSEKTAPPEKIQPVIKAVGIEPWLGQLPGGLQTHITENGKNISGGQQQRIAIARALYHEADLYLLDEPFNELDENSAGNILQHFKALAADGKIIVLVSHDPQCLRYCNKIISPNAG